MTARKTRLAAVFCLGLFTAGLAHAQIAFSDQTTAAGLVHQPDMADDMSAGAMFPGGAVADFNRDGWPDIFLIGGGDAADALFLNNGDGTFTDRASDWGLGSTPHRGLGATAGDFNKDGWPDLFVTSGGTVDGENRVGQHRLYRNNGDGTFTDVASTAGVTQASPTDPTATGSAFGDYDLDGDLDLIVCTWNADDGKRLFRNNGDETFTDVTVAAGIEQDFHGFSPRFVDMNGDRYPELLVAADFMTSRYFVNNQDGTFTNATASSGTGLDENGMGNTVGDFNRDGLPDWYVTSIFFGTARVGNFVYINDGNDHFTPLPDEAGAQDGGWGWGTDAIDIDHDGFIDLVETNGWTSAYENMESFLFRNNGDLTFTEVQAGSGFDHTGQGRSILLLDYDRDGDMDIGMTSYNGPFMLFRNDLSGPNTNWIEIGLDTSGDPALAPDGYGARVIATTGSVSQYFWINGGATYLGRSQPVAHFGLSDATSVDLTVEWPDGSATSHFDVPVNQILTLTPDGPTGRPGEASRQTEPMEQMRAAYDPVTGQIDVVYTPACGSSNHTIYYGALADVASYDYAGAECWCGATGGTSFDPAGMTDAFFLIVGNDGIVEGSYGRDASGLERPEETAALACELPLDLSATCEGP